MGCGRIAPKHADNLTSGRVHGAALVAVCDINHERAAKFGDKYGVPSFTSLAQMMSEMGDNIDVVNVLTPSGKHADHAVEVASHKKHVVVEKPMALSLGDADRMMSACDEAGVRLFVVKQNRYNLPVKKLREAVEAGR